MEINYFKGLLSILILIVVMNAVAALDFLTLSMWNYPIIPKSNTTLRLIVGFSGIIFLIAFVGIMLRFGHYLM